MGATMILLGSVRPRSLKGENSFVIGVLYRIEARTAEFAVEADMPQIEAQGHD